MYELFSWLKYIYKVKKSTAENILTQTLWKWPMLYLGMCKSFNMNITQFLLGICIMFFFQAKISNWMLWQARMLSYEVRTSQNVSVHIMTSFNYNLLVCDWCAHLWQTTTQPDLWTFINLNLAIVYLRTNRQSDLVTLLERVDPDKLSTWWDI